MVEEGCYRWRSTRKELLNGMGKQVYYEGGKQVRIQ